MFLPWLLVLGLCACADATDTSGTSTSLRPTMISTTGTSYTCDYGEIKFWEWEECWKNVLIVFAIFSALSAVIVSASVGIAALIECELCFGDIPDEALIG